ncbi:MAG: hypothetical protein P4M07_22195 [Xanthobacteraceae bacterium]|nr:hypothetical protein [Xanthobacteraceae bacterium]
MIYEVVAAIAAGAALASGPIDEDYTQAQPVNRLPPTFSSGQLRYEPTTGFLPPAAYLVVSNSELTLPAGALVGYTIGNLAKPVTKISGTFQFHAGTTGLGSVSFDVFNSLPNGVLTPESGFHIAITPIGWALQAFVSQIPTYNATTQSVQWTVPDLYAADAITWSQDPLIGSIPVAHAWFTVNGIGSALPIETPIYFQAVLMGATDDSATSATLTFLVGGSSGAPVTLYGDNGKQQSTPYQIPLSHVASSLPAVPLIGQYACWEVYQNASSDDRAGFLHIHAE